MVYDIAILGYGPTGATLANLLAIHGISVLVVDREADLYHLPRAVHFDDEVMRVFQTVGIADDLAKRVRVNPGMKFVDENDTLLLDWPRPMDITSHGWHASYRFHQPDLEGLLRTKLATKRTVDIVTDFDVSELTDAEDHVCLTGIARGASTTTSCNARYLVGCDGAKSLTRRVIGSEMEDLGFEERWLVVDLLLKRPRPELGDHSVQFCHSDRPMTYCRGPGDRRRWEMTVKNNESDTEMTDPERIWQLLSHWITPEDAILERSVVYTFHSKVAETWRRGRLMIAGDAAHLTPPFMGQGMCTGIRDAANLAWKLNACLEGASERLLDTYQAERAPHARVYVETAMRLGGLINALDRSSALKLAEDQALGRAKMRSITPKLGPSPLSQFGQSDHLGTTFGQIDMGHGQHGFDAKIGFNHAIISPKRPEVLPQNACWLSSKDHPALNKALSVLNAGAIWVRPDRYIGAVSDTTEGLLDQLFTFFDEKDHKRNETCLP